MIDTQRPAYRVLDPNGFYSDNDTLYAEGDEIYFDGEPNDQMEPLNEVAKECLKTYLTKLDDEAREAAVKLGRPYNGRPRNLDGALELATALQRQQISIMGTKNKDTSTEKVEQAEAPETGFNPNKRGRGRPPKTLAA